MVNLSSNFRKTNSHYLLIEFCNILLYKSFFSYELVKPGGSVFVMKMEDSSKILTMLRGEKKTF